MSRHESPVEVALPGRYRSLAAALFGWLFALVLAAFAVYAAVNVRTTSRQWQETVESDALRASDLILQSTRYGMLLNRKEDVHQIIRTVATAPGVVGVRIYDKQGTIIYSAQEPEIGRQVDLRAEACVACHEQDRPLSSLPRADRARVYRGADGGRILGLINPIHNEPACADGGCHAHPPEKTVLGVLDVQMSLAEADARLAATKSFSVGAAVTLALLVGATAAVLIDRGVRRPVHRLIDGTERLARGELGAAVDAGARNELGRLAEAFNRMSRDLARSRRENEEWSESLERKVVEKTEELSRSQRQVVHMEKMASLGKLAATVAHELNNPLAGILNYAKLVERELAEESAASPLGSAERAELLRFLGLIQRESGRCGEIVRNLLVFARRSGSELALHPLAPIVERALMVVRHLAEMNGVATAVEPLAGDDRLVCDADQVQQALVALLVNAIEAMKGGGRLTVSARAVEDPEAVELAVSDTGCGIPAENLPNLFEPFFTTKRDGGSGLGLAVVYGIVQRHGGTVEVDSEVGRGTTFRLRLPRKPSESPSQEVV